MMKSHQRYSPVQFEIRPDRTEIRDGWEVVLHYSNEGKGPFLVDLSHRTKWDVQDANLSKIQPGGVTIPEMPGHCVFQNGILINRMNRTQAAVWHLLGDSPDIAQGSAFTEVTESAAFLVIMGREGEIFSIMEKVTSLDLRLPENKQPFLVQGPISHVPCQIVVFNEKERGSAILFTCSRGYGMFMKQELLDTGTKWGLHPGGEIVFSNWIKRFIGQ